MAALLTDYMQKHLPGSTFVVRNNARAQVLVGANAINASKPDGLTIGTFNTGLIYKPAASNADGVRLTCRRCHGWKGCE